jgi:hypothetical protein
MALPVIVKLPDSWFGAVLAVALLGVGFGLIYVSTRNLRASEPE